MVPKGAKDAARYEHSALPPGYIPVVVHKDEVVTGEDERRLLTKRSWEMALRPLKQLPMSLFMMYMAGNSISIFPIMMVCMMFMQPVKALIGLKSTFVGVGTGDSRLILQKLVYIIGNLAGAGIAVYKCHSMGLLPTHSSDWLAFSAPQERAEFSGGGFAFAENKLSACCAQSIDFSGRF